MVPMSPKLSTPPASNKTAAQQAIEALSRQYIADELQRRIVDASPKSRTASELRRKENEAARQEKVEAFIAAAQGGADDEALAKDFAVSLWTIRKWRKERDVPAPPKTKPDPKHGTLARYRRLKCRCAACLDAHLGESRKRRAMNYAFTQRHGLPLSVQHGSHAYSYWGCRCEICSSANSEAAHRNLKLRANRASAPPLTDNQINSLQHALDRRINS
jgi:hypothetical protein